jgi:hypothetical protein
VTAQVVLVVMAPSVGTVGVVSLPMVCSCRGNGTADMQEPNVVEPTVEELYVEEPFSIRQGRAGSSGDSKPRLHW